MFERYVHYSFRALRWKGIFLGVVLCTQILVLCFVSQSFGFDHVLPILFKEKKKPVLHPHVQNVFAEKSEDETGIVWIFFTDKGIFTEETYADKCRQIEVSLSERVRWRRGKVNGTRLVDFHDLPVHDEYIEEILASGAKHRTTTKWFNGISVEISLSSLDTIASLPFVREIRLVNRSEKIPMHPQPSPHRRLQKTPFQLDYGESFDQLQQINVPAVHELGYSGAGVLVCLIDTGFNRTHEALQHIDLVAEWDFINDDGNTQDEPGDPQRQNDHGANVLSIFGGAQPGELYGPAYGASFLLAKTEIAALEQPIEEDYWVEGIEWAEAQGADVVSSSLSYNEWYTYEDMDGNTAITTRAVDLAVSRGIVACNSAGNSRMYPWFYISAPADADSVIACGAVDANGTIGISSSGGPTADGRIKPEVVARGVLTRYASPGDPEGYLRGDGTSLSTPLVAGSAALILEAHPDWTSMQVREALMMTADRADHPDTVYGWGLIDVLAAIAYECDIEVTTPDGGEGLIAGETTMITWTSENTTGEVSVTYSTDGGADWDTIETIVPDNGSYEWTVPYTPSENVVVKICDVDYPTCYDQSDDSFTIILPCVFTIDTPIGGESWCVGEERSITWSSQVTSGQVAIEYSTDGGTQWFSVVPATPDVGTYLWTVPQTVSINCFLKIYDVEIPVCFDQTAAPFKISECGDLTIVTENLPDGEITCRYEEILRAAGGVLPYSWSVVDGVLPSGLNVEGATGRISGRPDSLGTFGFTVEIEDDQGATGTGVLTLTIVEYTGMKSDPTFDCEINILDALMTINIILENISPSPEENWAADCNGAVGHCDGDGTVDILDVIKIVNLVLGIDECQ